MPCGFFMRGRTLNQELLPGHLPFACLCPLRGYQETVSYHLPGSNEVWGLLALKLQNIKPLSCSLDFAPQQWSPSKLTVVIWTLLFQIPFAVWRLEGAGTFG